MQIHNPITDPVLLPLPWQAELKPGDHYIIKSPLIGSDIPMEALVYGQILDARNCEAGFFNVIEYSAYFPNGLEGEVCILDVTQAISRDEFEAARREEWTV